MMMGMVMRKREWTMFLCPVQFSSMTISERERKKERIFKSCRRSEKAKMWKEGRSCC